VQKMILRQHDRSQRTPFVLVATAFLSFAFVASAANATPVTFDFTGTLTTGAAFTGQYTFDSAAQDTAASPNSGRYVSIGPEFAFVLNTGGSRFSVDGTLVGVDDHNSYRVSAFGNDDRDVLALQLDFASDVFADDSEPLTPPSLSGATNNSLFVRGFGLPGDLFGTFTSLTCATCAPETSVPEPGMLTLFGAGLLMLGYVARRRTAMSARSLGMTANACA
jgi:hypothetical protein